MTTKERAERLVDEAVLWVPALNRGMHTQETRQARRRFDYHLGLLSKELGWTSQSTLQAHLAAVHLAKDRLAELPASGKAGKQP